MGITRPWIFPRPARPHRRRASGWRVGRVRAMPAHRPVEAQRFAVSDVSLTIGAAALGVIVTALLLWSPYVVFGVRNPTVHLVLDTVDACVALLVAYLVHGRFVRHGHLQDLLLALGLVLLAGAGFGLTYAMQELSDAPEGTLDIWLPLALRVMGALLIVSAALARSRPAMKVVWRNGTAKAPVAVFGVTAGVAAVCAVLWSQRSGLPVALDETRVPSSAEHALLTGHPLLLTAQAFTALCFAVAAVAFAGQSTRHGDELLRWLGPACVLAAFARLNYVLFPSLYTDWLYTGDLLRTGCYLLLLVGAMREMQQYWSAQSRAAVLEDRRRLARELHDGVMQELAYIRSESHLLREAGVAAPRIIAAADRGLNEARAALNALDGPGDEPLGFTLHRAARELAERYRIDLDVDVDDSVDAAPEQRHALTRIAREAVSNAVNHGDATRVSIKLGRSGDGRCLVVHDNGCGFDVCAPTSHRAGYGLTSMRERADGLPGSFTVESEPGTGSVVTVEW